MLRFNFVDRLIEEIEFNGRDRSADNDVDTYVADSVFNIITELIDKEKVITETFVSKTAKKTHYKKHCLDNKNRTSVVDNILYDFNSLSDFANYEQHINNIVTHPTFEITTLYDSKKVLKAFRKLFEGGVSIQFGVACGFSNISGSVKVCLHSFASDVTQNYKNGNTVDLLILSPKDYTISMYPVDCHYLETKINNMIKHHAKHKKLQFLFNVD